MTVEVEKETEDNRMTLYHVIQTRNGPQIIAFLEKLSSAQIALYHPPRSIRSSPPA
jgi:hypothetical protein